ncbi:DUF4023 domain-containing protein [Bacillus andreraoultii]|uniref:DUF4023 domain-containing protein n=1 Tax=Bacillus andreraoultii TaxID=1499685 RepID=UPI00053A449B|nr:DUF4023 domain-containing protein [Bacillus andreraoultii]
MTPFNATNFYYFQTVTGKLLEVIGLLAVLCMYEFFRIGKSIHIMIKGVAKMKDTSQFVHDIQEKQRKDLKNKKRQGDNNPDEKLPNHKH